MRVLLMHPDRDFDAEAGRPWNESALTQDLDLETLLGAMAAGDDFVHDVARTAMLCGMGNGIATILHRQAVLKDCLQNRAVVLEMYQLAVETIEKRRQYWLSIVSHYASGILYGAIELMEMYADMLGRLRHIAEQHAAQFESPGFRSLFAMLAAELGDDYLAAIRHHLHDLRFPDGVLISAALGAGNAGSDYVLHRPVGKAPGWLDRLFGKGEPAYTFHIDEHDESGGNILSGMRDRGIAQVANALAQSTDHVLQFFRALRTELAFYVGCLNLHGRLTAKGEPLCFPQPVAPGERRLRCDGLYDVCLALHREARVVGNAADAGGKDIIVITGANQGGKSSFLRGIGLAQLMMQSGMFVAATSFEGALCTGLYTHYVREEDAAMKQGKFDEELARMSDIADHLAPHALLLFNESFAATNAREGSEIARQIVDALLERRIRVVFVTHLYDLAHDFYARTLANALFLRAERRDDGTRSFKLIEGAPQATSHGADLYRQVFGDAAAEGGA